MYGVDVSISVVLCDIWIVILFYFLKMCSVYFKLQGNFSEMNLPIIVSHYFIALTMYIFLRVLNLYTLR